MADGTAVTFLPFLNVTPLKQAWIGVATVLVLIIWAWRNRGSRRVVYCYNLTVPPGIFTLLACRVTGTAAVGHISDVNVPGETVPRTMLYAIDYFLQRLAMPRFDALTIVSSEIARNLAPHIRTLKMEGGIRPELFTRRPSRPRDGSTFVVVAAGSLDEANGIREIVEAFGMLRGENLRLAVAGAGPLESVVQDAARRDPRIKYLGYVSFDRVLRLYAEGDVLVSMRITQALNTRYFFPSKLMEYLASGTPVVTTCTGHVEEEFGSFVYALREETPAGLAALLEKVSSIPAEERQAVGARAQAYMLDRKSWAAQGGRIAGLLESVAGNPREREKQGT